MARKTSLTSLHQISEINLTPLIDLTFLLLITFIITFPLMEQGIAVNLPRGKADPLDPEESRSISLNLQGQLYLDDVMISKEELATEMTQLGAASPDVTVLVRADEGIRYGQVVEIMKILHDAKIARMALVTQEEAKPSR